jgi:hypothetical protein
VELLFTFAVVIDELSVTVFPASFNVVSGLVAVFVDVVTNVVVLFVVLPDFVVLSEFMFLVVGAVSVFVTVSESVELIVVVDFEFPVLLQDVKTSKMMQMKNRNIFFIK